jgi:hypothetical protein
MGVQYAHKKINPAIEANTLSQNFYTLVYIGIGSVATALFMSNYSDVLNECLCTIFNLPLESTKENVEVFIGDPEF